MEHELAYNPVLCSDPTNMMEVGMEFKRVIGVDVGKNFLDVACEGTATIKRYANVASEIARFVGSLSIDDVVVFERTGGYERALQTALMYADVCWAVVHSAKVKAFRDFQGVKAKTDCIDARLLQEFGRNRLDAGKLRLGCVEDEVLVNLKARRRQLRRMLHGEQCRLAIAGNSVVAGSIERIIAMLEAELAAIESELASHITRDPLLTLKHRAMCEQIGIADVSACSLLCELPELGTLGRKPITALGGLAARVHKSGRTDLRRGLVRGRNPVKAILFNPARSAMRWDPEIKAFVGRLRARGKPGKVIMVAVMRKLLVRLNARARDALATHAAETSAALRHSEPSMTAGPRGIGRRQSRLAEGHRRRRRVAALTAKPDAARSSRLDIRG
jgi:transposase